MRALHISTIAALSITLGISVYFAFHQNISTPFQASTAPTTFGVGSYVNVTSCSDIGELKDGTQLNGDQACAGRGGVCTGAGPYTGLGLTNPKPVAQFNCSASCGDGIGYAPTEECDQGSLNGTPYSTCTTECKYCGNNQKVSGADCSCPYPKCESVCANSPSTCGVAGLGDNCEGVACAYHERFDKQQNKIVPACDTVFWNCVSCEDFDRLKSEEEKEMCLCTEPSDHCSATVCTPDPQGNYSGACNTPCQGGVSTDCYEMVGSTRVQRGHYTEDPFCGSGLGGQFYCRFSGTGGTLGGAYGGSGGGSSTPTSSSPGGGGSSAGNGGNNGGNTGGNNGGTGGSSAGPGSSTQSSVSSTAPSSVPTSSSFYSSFSVSSSDSSSSSQSSVSFSFSVSSFSQSYINSFSNSVSFSQSFSNSLSNSLSFSQSFSNSLSFSQSFSQSFSLSSTSQSSSNSSSSSLQCNGNECAAFGDFYCGLNNTGCLSIPEAPCFTCEGQLSSSFSFSSQSLSSSSSLSFSSSSSSFEDIILSSSSSRVSSQDSSFIIAQNFCGDGFVDIDEECDDGNNFDFDGCSYDCRLEECIDDLECPDGVCLSGRCSYSSSSAFSFPSSSAFSIRSTPASYCGNNFLELGEQCDDGNRNSGDGCSSTCRFEQVGCYTNDDCAIGTCINNSCIPCLTDDECAFGRCVNNSCQVPTLTAATALCGNGILESPEECDDSNTRDNDGCTNTCLLEVGICGDGVVQKLLGEQCETSLHNPTLPYTCQNCRFASTLCGNGTLDPGEECDNGQANSLNPDAACRPDCSRSRCGDGILDSAELCDDGNTKNGDGCDRFCKTETPTNLVAGQNITFPTQNTTQPLPFQLPLANLQPLIQQQGPVGDTGPAAVAVLGAGAASGIAWVRRRKRK